MVAVVSRIDDHCLFRVGESVVNEESRVDVEHLEEVASYSGC